ncbi:MAG: GTP-binding protein [bacterium]|nr:GTP-binding protein [bacterium]
MGHVDHGKTTLLDTIRKTSVAAREAGGITQAIGAYEIEVHPKNEPKSRASGTERGIPRQTPRDDFANNVRKITFIDTPGHEAFSAMRVHGAKCADLAILVVAADDGVKPQTKDALAAIQAEKLPFIVAVNKMDKPGADVEKVKQELAQAGVFLEGYGGNVSWHAISAKTGEGVSDLLDLILLASDIEATTYDPDAPASGIVLTTKFDKRRGTVAGVVLTNGTLRRGDCITTETAFGKVKILEDFRGKPATALVPSAPALVVGFEKIPHVGEVFTAGPGVTGPKPVERAFPTRQKEAEKPADRIAVVLKADEGGSLEALHGVIIKLAKTHPFHIIHQSVGDIYETDVKTAESMGAFLVGFRTGVDRAAQNLAQAKKLAILTSPVIYELERALTEYAQKRIAKEVRALEVLAIFGAAKGKQRVVGGRVTLGPVRTNEHFEVWRETKLLCTGLILNLQSGRQDATEVATGTEAGLLVETEESIRIGDRLVFPDA